MESIEFQSPISATTQFQKFFKDREIDRKQILKKQQPPIPVNSIRGSQPSLELGYLNEKHTTVNPSQPNSKPKPNQEGVQGNLDVLVKKLDTLNKVFLDIFSSLTLFFSNNLKQ